MDLPGAQRVMSVLATLLLVAALLVGFWPLSVTVVGDVSYSCGSGFVHSRHTWVIDTEGLNGTPRGSGSTTATPTSACPSTIYGHRDLAIVLGALAFLGAIVALVLGPPLDANRRRRAPPPHHAPHLPHPQPEERSGCGRSSLAGDS